MTQTDPEQIPEAIVYEYDGRTTKCLINFLGVTAQGKAVCNTTDKYSEGLGELISLSRAITDLGGQLENRFLGYPVPIKEWFSRHPRKKLPPLPK